jgi:hypothetical protein
VRAAASFIHRMDKVLTEMNVRLSSAVTDLSGATGLAIIQAIVDGERDPHKLAAYRDPRVKATQKEIARQLHGNWQADGLLRLKQELQTFKPSLQNATRSWPSCCVPFPIVALASCWAKIHAKVDARKKGGILRNSICVSCSI